MTRRPITLLVAVSVLRAGAVFADPGSVAPAVAEGAGTAVGSAAPQVAPELAAASSPVTAAIDGAAPAAAPQPVPTVTPAMLHAASTAATAGPAGAGPQLSYAMADRIVVHKSLRRLDLLLGDRVIASYPVRLGLNPLGPKEREGDFRTPEGTYQLTRRNQYSDFFLSIGVSYPNDGDRQRAKRQRVAPGGSIMIHGQPNFPRKPADYYAGNDWTDGCIAVSNSDMVDIWLRTRIGLPIEIRP